MIHSESKLPYIVPEVSSFDLTLEQMLCTSDPNTPGPALPWIPDDGSIF
jgi:hypothetical protein